MMSKRKENIRKDCDEINRWCEAIKKLVDKNANQIVIRNTLIFTELIKEHTHRIKRTTWRGDVYGHRPELRLACTCKVCVPTVINKMSKWDKSWKDYNNLAKRINTNQTTTANIDVSTIPYY